MRVPLFIIHFRLGFSMKSTIHFPKSSILNRIFHYQPSKSSIFRLGFSMKSTIHFPKSSILNRIFHYQPSKSSIFRLGFSMINQQFWGFPMVFLWFSYGFPMVFLWFSYGFPMVFLWFGVPPRLRKPTGYHVRRGTSGRPDSPTEMPVPTDVPSPTTPCEDEGHPL